MVIAKIDLVSLYFRLLWFHSILWGSVDQKHAKKTKFEDKTVKFTQPSLVLIGLHDFLIFSNRKAQAWSVEVGNRCSVSVFFAQVGSQIFPRRAKKDSNIPSPSWENKISQIPYPRANKDNQIPTKTLSQWISVVNSIVGSCKIASSKKVTMSGLKTV